MIKAKTRPELKLPTKSKDFPATQGMLQLVRSELKAEMKAGFRQIDSKLEQVLSEVSRTGLLVEEQNARNRIVMEGLTGLYHRQERVEIHVKDIENLVQAIGARPKR